MSRYTDRRRDIVRMRWVKEQQCAVSLDLVVLELAGPCEGVTECDHGGGAGMGRRNTEESGRMLSLCVRHHRLPGLEHLLFGKVEHGFVRHWKKEQGEVYRIAYEHQMAVES